MANPTIAVYAAAYLGGQIGGLTLGSIICKKVQSLEVRKSRPAAKDLLALQKAIFPQLTK